MSPALWSALPAHRVQPGSMPEYVRRGEARTLSTVHHDPKCTDGIRRFHPLTKTMNVVFQLSLNVAGFEHRRGLGVVRKHLHPLQTFHQLPLAQRTNVVGHVDGLQGGLIVGR